MNRRCSQCKRIKEIDDFSLDKLQQGGHHTICKSCRSMYMKFYVKKHKNEIKTNRHKRYLKHRKKELEKNRRNRKLRGHIWNQNRIKKHQQNPLIAMCRQAKIRAKIKGLSFDISPSDLTVPKMCPVLGIPLHVSRNKVSSNSPSLNRIENEKGYVKGNVEVISFKANTIKSSASIEELEKVLTYYKGLKYE